MSQETRAAHASSVPNLADLISARKAERGWSYQQLADRVNGAVSRQRWQQLGTGTRIKEFPEPATIQSIADALEVDITLVVLAVARSIGFAVRNRDSSLAAMLPPGAAHLSSEQRDAILAVVRVMAPATGATDDNTSTQTSTPRDPEAGSSTRIGASIAALSETLSEAEVKTLRQVRGKLAHHPGARGESVALLTGLLGQLLDTVSNPELANAWWNLTPGTDVSADWSPAQRAAIEEGKAAAATSPNEGASGDRRHDYELARRAGKTQERVRRETETQPEDESQGDAPEEGA